MPVRLIALDIDNTLTTTEKKITPRTKSALLTMEQQGVRLALASARPLPGLYEYRDILKMEKYQGILMAYNGGRIADAVTGEILSEISMDMEVTRDILRFLEKLPVTVILDDGSQFYVTDPEGYKVQYECRNNRMTCSTVENLAEFLHFAPVKLLLAVEPSLIYEVQEQIAAYLPEDMVIVRTAAFYLEIIPRAINKGQGLQQICDTLGIDLQDTMAFGDSENDLPMILQAGTGVAMANAEEGVKSAADIITLSNNEDGIAEVLKMYIGE